MSILLIWSLVIISGYLFEIISKKRVKGALPLIILFFLIILMGGNTQNPDTQIYLNIFNNKEFFTRDVGFGILVECFNNYGFEYQTLKFFVSILGLTLIHITVNKLVEDPKLYYFLYFLYPFFLDIVQVRNFLAMSIFIFAIPNLLEDSKKGNIKYILLVLLAALIQKTAIVYLPIVFIKNLDSYKVSRKFFILIIVASIIIGVFKPLLYNLIDILKIYFADSLEGLDQQLSVTTNFGWIINWIIQFVNFWLVRRNKIMIFTQQNLDIKNMKLKTKFIEVLYNINLYMFIFLPLYVLTPTFARIMRNVIPLNWISFAIIGDMVYVEKNENYRLIKKQFIILPIMYVAVIFCVIFLYGESNYFEKIVMEAFKSNTLVEWLRI